MTNNSYKCLINNNTSVKILDFGMHPYADTFISEDQLSLPEPILPLQLFLDEESGIIQLGNISDAYERYNLYKYSYTSSNSKFAQDHWTAYARTMQDNFLNGSSKFVIEIGSNDGFLLSKLRSKNSVLGLDASEEMAKIANDNQVPTISCIFDEEAAIEIKKQHGLADLIIANNVFNHSNDPLSFAKGVEIMLSNDGVFVFELPYWAETVKSGRFDQIYHEHITYFTVKSSFNLLSKAGLEIFDVEFVDYHGGSVRVYSRKAESPKIIPLVQGIIDEETNNGLFDKDMYKKWQNEIKSEKIKFMKNIYDLINENPDAVIIGVGAAAKANTLLNYYKLDNSLIKFVTDSSEFKQGKYTPLSRIPIVGDQIFSQFTDVYALILSWNISESLKNTLSEINPGIKYIKL